MLYTFTHYRARIDRLLSSGAHLADLVDEATGTEIRRVCAECVAVADEAALDADPVAAYVAMEDEVHRLFEWLSGIMYEQGLHAKKPFFDGLCAASDAAMAAVQAVATVDNEYDYRDRAIAALEAVQAFAASCQYSVALDGYDRTLASDRSWSLHRACVECWQQVSRGLGRRVLRYRREAYEEGSKALWAAQAAAGTVESAIAKAMVTDVSLRASLKAGG